MTDRFETEINSWS